MCGKGFVLDVFFCLVALRNLDKPLIVSLLLPYTSKTNQSFYDYPGSLIYLSSFSQLPKQTNNLLFT